MTIRQTTQKFLIVFLVALVTATAPWSVQANDELWGKVQTGKLLIIIRHALAPGTGDPSNFDVTRCETQRNLSDTGRQQAKGIASQWCRCIETAELMNIGKVEEQPLLNSFFANPAAGPAQTKKLRAWLLELDSGQPTILITHQVVISALTDVYPTSGEAVVFKIDSNGNAEVLKRITTKH